MSRELPLLATASVALALRTCRQTQDRRPIRNQPDWSVPRPLGWRTAGDSSLWSCESDPGHDVRRAPWQKGDLLYVREPTMVINARGAEEIRVRYDSTNEERWVPWPDRIKSPGAGRRLANGCYREAAQTWLRVIDVRPERLQDITELHAWGEGVDPLPGVGANQQLAGDNTRRTFGTHPYTGAFAVLWDGIYERREAVRWAANPWVWATTVELDRERSGLIETAAAHG